MSNPNTDTVEAVALSIGEAVYDLRSCSNSLARQVEATKLAGGETYVRVYDPAFLRSALDNAITVLEQARAAIATMPGSGEAMREAAARVIEDNIIAYSSGGSSLQPRGEGDKNGLAFAAAIRALPLPQGGGSAADERDRALAEVGRLSEVLRQIGRKDTKPYVQIGADPNFPGETLYVPGEYAEIAYAALEKSAAMLAAAPLPPAAEPYAWLCTSPELDPVIVYGRENAETYAAHSERWTVEPLCRGATLGAPLPPAQEG